MEAEKKSLTYQEFLGKLLKHEIRRRDEKSMERRLKQAAFPEHKTLDEFDVGKQQSLSKKKNIHLLAQPVHFLLVDYQLRTSRNSAVQLL